MPGRAAVDQAGLEQLYGFVARADALAPNVSAWSVGQHLEHCCLVVHAICEALTRSVPPPPREGFSLLRFAMLRTGYIPRGRGKAPPVVTPTRQASSEELRDQLATAKAELEAASALSPEAWFRHFVFGVMNRDQSLRFLAIHNSHHLKIIRDVVAHSSGSTS